MLVYDRAHPTGFEANSRVMRATPEQDQYIAQQRAMFNQREARMSAALGSVQTRIGNAAPVPRDVWGEWDREGIAIQRDVLSVFGDLASSVSFAMPIGKLVHYFQQISDSGSVNISMDGRSKGRTDRQVYTYQGTPLPIVDSPFSYGWRDVAAAQTEGYQLDSAGRANAMYKVAEKLENIALSGDSSIVVGGDTLYGLTNHPKRNTRSTTNTLNAATGAQWLADVNATLKLLHGDNFRVPATLYVNWDDWFYATSTDFSTAYPNKTIAQRILENGGVREVIPASKVAANTIIAVVKDSRVLQVLNGMPMSTRAQFRANPEDDYNFVTLAAAALEIKYDADDNCGVAHSS